MSYEYEASIKEAINIEYHADFSGYMNRIKELDHVYSQAAKSNEYEAKAKAFDQIEKLVKIELTSDDLYNDARNNDYVAGMLRVYERIDYIIDYFESGEYREFGRA